MQAPELIIFEARDGSIIDPGALGVQSQDLAAANLEQRQQRLRQAVHRVSAAKLLSPNTNADDDTLTTALLGKGMP